MKKKNPVFKIIVDRFFASVGLGVYRLPRIPADFMAEYRRSYRRLEAAPGPFRLLRQLYYDAGSHPSSYMDYECVFAARHLSRFTPVRILDVGSYRMFILGLLAHYAVTTLDVRPREAVLPGETTLTSDAKRINAPSGQFDAVTSLCTLEHLGLGRYGDEFDPEADKKAMLEMIRVLKPGGRLIFSTNVTRSEPSIVYNAHRIYSLEMLRGFCAGLEREDEVFYSLERQQYCAYDQVTAVPGEWDVYCGCWRKPLSAGEATGSSGSP